MKKHSATIRDRLPGCLIKWLEEKTEANAQNENAMQILKEAIKTAANDPMMTAEVKELADTIILLIEDRNLIDYTFDGIMEPVVKIVTSDTKSQSGKKAIDARHNKPGGAREKKETLREIWAKGDYRTHKDCAENEGHKVGYSYDGALKALRNARDPYPWPAKEVIASKAKK